MTIPAKKIRHSTDGRRGYYVFDNSVYSTYCTGNYEDSPRKPADVKSDLDARRKILKSAGIGTKRAVTNTSNCFSIGIDLLVHPDHLERAKQLLKDADL